MLKLQHTPLIPAEAEIQIRQRTGSPLSRGQAEIYRANYIFSTVGMTSRHGLVNLAHIYSPELLILGGGVTAGLEQMRPVIAAEFARRAMSPFRDIPFVRAALLDNAGLIGAAALGRAQALAGR